MPIYELSYKRIEGLRAVARIRFVPIAGAIVKQFVRKKLQFALLLLGGAPFLVSLFFLCFPMAFPTFVESVPPEIKRFFTVGPDAAYQYLTSVFASGYVTLIVMAVAGSAAIAEDFKSNALELYFSRPITRIDYLLGKISGVLALGGIVSAAPLLVLFVVDLAISPIDGHLATQLALLPRLLLASLVVTVPWALLALALSTLSRSPRNVLIAFGAIVVLGTGLSKIFLGMVKERAILLCDLKGIVDRVTYDVLGVGTESSANTYTATMKQFGLSGLPLGVEAPLQGVSSEACVGVLSAVVAICLGLLLWRVRGYEVVRG